VKDLGGLLGWQGVSIQMWVAEVTGIDECEGLDA
jgi:hypothetical protein